MERKTMFLHFMPQEKIPVRGETVLQTSALTHLTYSVKILMVLKRSTMDDGRIELKVDATVEPVEG